MKDSLIWRILDIDTVQMQMFLQGRAVHCHPGRLGDVLRKPKVCRQLEGKWKDWWFNLALAIATKNDFGEDFCPSEPETHQGGSRSNCAFHKPVDIF